MGVQQRKEGLRPGIPPYGQGACRRLGRDFGRGVLGLRGLGGRAVVRRRVIVARGVDDLGRAGDVGLAVAVDRAGDLRRILDLDIPGFQIDIAADLAVEDHRAGCGEDVAPDAAADDQLARRRIQVAADRAAQRQAVAADEGVVEAAAVNGDGHARDKRILAGARHADIAARQEQQAFDIGRVGRVGAGLEDRRVTAAAEGLFPGVVLHLGKGGR